MYRPVYDSQKAGLIRRVLDRAECVNAETPWTAAFTLDDALTELQLELTLQKPIKEAFAIRLVPETPHTDYNEDREFKAERAFFMNDLAAYLQALIDEHLSPVQGADPT